MNDTTVPTPADADTEDSFIAQEHEVPEPVDSPEDNADDVLQRVNLADDDDLVKHVMAHLESKLGKYKTERGELEDIWQVGDYMLKCGQDATLQESERERIDRQGDDMNKTKAQKVGCTMFFRQVRTLAALFTDILTSKRDPFVFRSRNNPDVFFSAGQADELAEQHNLLMRWTRDQENFTVKCIDSFFSLLTHGNIVLHSRWLRRKADILDRWPVMVDVPGGIDPETGEEIPATRKVDGTKIERRMITVDNRPVMDVIPIEDMYCDQNIGDMQKQQVVIISSPVPYSDILDVEREGEYVNVDKIDSTKIYQGRTSDSMHADRETNAGYESGTDDSATGLLQQYDATAMLPIDESKPAGKRWDSKKHVAKKFWVTVIHSFTDGVCLRIERNPDPDDEMPFEIVPLFPKDPDKAYGLSPAQILRGTYSEQTTMKMQLIDHGTLLNNRPLWVVAGEVHIDGTDDLKFGKDKVYQVDSKNSMGEFQMDTTPYTVTMGMLAYLDSDSDETMGTVSAVRGQAMGGRTSAGEATNAYTAARLPHKMTVQYVLHRLLRFYAKKGIRLWHLHAEDDQILKITDGEEVYRNVRPIDLFGDFDVEVNIVDQFEQSMLQEQMMTFTMQNILPIYMDILDKRESFKDIADKFLHIDVSRWIKPDLSEQSKLLARTEHETMRNGGYVEPTPDEDFDTMLREHQGERIQYRGMENQDEATTAYMIALDRHIEMTEFLKKQSAARQPMASQPGAPQNQSDGEVAGNAIAGMEGAMQQ